MNATLNWSYWSSLLAGLGLGTVFIFGVLALLQHWIRSALWRRTLWQAGFLGVLLLAATALSGSNRIASSWLSQQTETEPRVQWTVQSVASTMPDVESLMARRGKENSTISTPPVSEKRAPSRSIWWPGTVWLLGFGLVTLRMAGGRLLFLLFVQRRPVRDGILLARVDSVARRLGVARRVRVAETPGLAGPIAFGVIRPGISLPDGFSRRFNGEQQDAMLAHELAHLSARDPLWLALADAVAALLWWHPLVWLARRQLHNASEAAADEASLLVENGPSVLAECLVELGGRLTRTRSLGWLGMAGDNFRSGLGRRVKRLITLNGRPWKPVARRHNWLAKTFIPLALVAAVLGGTAWTQPSEAGAATLKQAFQRSILGLALVAAMPAPQETLVPGAVTNRVTDATTAPAPADESSVLHTRSFKIDPITFSRSLSELLKTNLDGAISEVTRGPKTLPDSTATGLVQRTVVKLNSSEMLVSDARRFFSLAGVDFTEAGKQLFLNDRSGQLMVRATLQDLDIIEQAVQVLNTPPPQVTIEVKFCEMTTDDARALGLDWVLGGEFTNTLNRADSRKTNFQATGILTDSQCRVVLQALEKRKGVNILTAPKLTTLSGRPAQMKTVQVRYVVTDLDWSNLGVNGALRTNGTVQAQPITNGTLQAQPIAEPFELGPVLDVVPFVLADGYTIQMTLIPTLTEFLGYDLDNGNRRETVTMPDGRKEIVTVPNQPCPIFRKRQMVSSAIVRDGQTVVLFAGSELFFSNPTKNEPLRKGTKLPDNSPKTNLLIFVTPTLIDSAGNRIHEPEEIPPGVPPQK